MPEEDQRWTSSQGVDISFSETEQKKCYWLGCCLSQDCVLEATKSDALRQEPGATSDIFNEK